jgi:hypothetical protein
VPGLHVLLLDNRNKHVSLVRLSDENRSHSILHIIQHSPSPFSTLYHFCTCRFSIFVLLYCTCTSKDDTFVLSRHLPPIQAILRSRPQLQFPTPSKLYCATDTSHLILSCLINSTSLFFLYTVLSTIFDWKIRLES